MNHLKYFNESLINKTQEEYQSLIEDCILYLTDSYQYESFYTPEYENNVPMFSYMFKIPYKYDINELLDLLDSSHNRLVHEMNPDIKFALSLLDHDECSVLSTDGGVSLGMIKRFLASPKFQLHYGTSLLLTLIIS